jgi:dTDP-4-dehydrorhamnose 3,5-epimerase
MQVIDTDIFGAKVLVPKRYGDHRGFFSEVYSKKVFLEAGIEADFVQDNHSFSANRGVVRGLHFQLPPFAQAKLVRVSRGSIFDVIVDLRKGSPSFGKSFAHTLGAENWHQLFVPEGCAHGFCTLEADCEVLYKASAYYAPDYERGLRWNDQELGIDWPVRESQAILSDRDRSWPALHDLEDLFEISSTADA